MKRPTEEQLKKFHNEYYRAMAKRRRDHERATRGLYYMSRMIPQNPPFYLWLAGHHPEFRQWAEWMQDS